MRSRPQPAEIDKPNVRAYVASLYGESKVVMGVHVSVGFEVVDRIPQMGSGKFLYIINDYRRTNGQLGRKVTVP